MPKYFPHLNIYLVDLRVNKLSKKKNSIYTKN